MNVDIFTQQIQVMHKRLDTLYRGVDASAQLQPELLPIVFKELGTASEELQIAIEELLLQNEELASAQASLTAERQRYQDLFQFASAAYLMTDKHGTVIEANNAAAKLLNVPPQFLFGKPIAVFVAEPERQLFHLQLTWLQQQKQREQELNVRLAPRQGNSFDATMIIATVNSWEEKSVALHIHIRESTTKKQKQVAADKNESNFSQELPRHVYLKGELIPLKPKTIWQVCQGIVKLSTMSEKGEEVLVGLAGPGMPFGSDLTALQTYQATALSEAQLVCFSLTDLEAYPQLAQTLLPKINQRLQQTESLLAISGQRHVKDRFYQLLQLLKQEVGQPVAQGIRLSVRLTHQDLADACSTTRVTITRLLGKF
ncbi:MAG: PAS domain-containing protein, partial [Chroococcidiopsidaceae cyanobacterium CP_BM_RX_35]|nr:PAS domain-containing protein [Chroococcidiopsidaceae cyanobacterium CP_BM_RX_35]